MAARRTRSVDPEAVLTAKKYAAECGTSVSEPVETYPAAVNSASTAPASTPWWIGPIVLMAWSGCTPTPGVDLAAPISPAPQSGPPVDAIPPNVPGAESGAASERDREREIEWECIGGTAVGAGTLAALDATFAAVTGRDDDRIGDWLTTTPDLDGDGRQEFVAYFNDWDGEEGGSKLGLFLPGDLTLDAGRSDASSTFYGFGLSVPGRAVDLDLDGNWELSHRDGSLTVVYDSTLGAGLLAAEDAEVFFCQGWYNVAPPVLSDLTGDGLPDVFNVNGYVLHPYDFELWELGRRWSDGAPCASYDPDMTLLGALVGETANGGEHHASGGMAALADFDADGLEDVAASRTNFLAVDILRTPFPLGALALEDYLTARWVADTLELPNDLSVDGDVDGDGQPDILVGADGNMNPDPERWEVWLLGTRDLEPGDHDLADATATLFYPSEGYESLYALNVDIVGDIDGDGYAEIAVNSGGNSLLPGPSEPAINIWFGPACGEYAMETEVDLAIAGVGGEQFGNEFKGAELTGDAHADIVVAAFDHLTDEGYSGKVYLLDGLDILDGMSALRVGP
jgi:hypothetical protein